MVLLAFGVALAQPGEAPEADPDPEPISEPISEPIPEPELPPRDVVVTGRIRNGQGQRPGGVLPVWARLVRGTGSGRHREAPAVWRADSMLVEFSDGGFRLELSGLPDASGSMLLELRVDQRQLQPLAVLAGGARSILEYRPCPLGMVAAEGDLCTDRFLRPGLSSFLHARGGCEERGFRLCRLEEWLGICRDAAALGLSDMRGGEWVDESYIETTMPFGVRAVVGRGEGCEADPGGSRAGRERWFWRCCAGRD